MYGIIDLYPEITSKFLRFCSTCNLFLILYVPGQILSEIYLYCSNNVKGYEERKRESLAAGPGRFRRLFDAAFFKFQFPDFLLELGLTYLKDLLRAAGVIPWFSRVI